MLKMIGIMILCFSIFSFGFYYDALQRDRIRKLDKMERLIAFISCKIQYFQIDIFTIFLLASKETEFRAFGFLKPFSNLKQEWNLQKIDSLLPATFPQKEMALSFFAGLGQTDICGQLEHCSAYQNTFLKKKEEFCLEYNTKGKIYRSLSAFVAAGIAILLI